MRLAATYFTEDPTQSYPALITRVKPFALFFEIPRFGLEASLHISQLGHDYYEYNAVQMSFRGARTGKTFTVGQPIEVKLDRIDFILQKTEWSLVTPAKTLAKRKKRSY